MAISSKELQFEVPGKGEVSAIYTRPPKAKAMYVLAHGAGAGMRHPFLEEATSKLFTEGIAVFRFQFVYMEAGRKAPDSAKVLEATVRCAYDKARSLARGLPIFVGGKSMGGRIFSQAVAKGEVADTAGLIFLGFPLHAAGKASIKRAEHFEDIGVPTLFVQGTRDTLADLTLLAPIVKQHRHAQMHIVEGGDHSFKVLKRSGRTNEEAMNELVKAASTFVTKTL